MQRWVRRKVRTGEEAGWMRAGEDAPGFGNKGEGMANITRVNLWSKDCNRTAALTWMLPASLDPPPGPPQDLAAFCFESIKQGAGKLMSLRNLSRH